MSRARASRDWSDVFLVQEIISFYRHERQQRNRSRYAGEGREGGGGGGMKRYACVCALRLRVISEIRNIRVERGRNCISSSYIAPRAVMALLTFVNINARLFRI